MVNRLYFNRKQLKNKETLLKYKHIKKIARRIRCDYVNSL